VDDKNIIIGITGTLGAGKGTIVDYLKKKGFKHYSVRHFIVEEIKKRGLPVIRDNMVVVANNLREQFGPSYIVEILYERAVKQGGNCIIESIRTTGEIQGLRKKGRFYLLAVDAEPKLRYERIRKRNDAQSDKVDFDKFMDDERKESISDDAGKQNLVKCIQMADYRFDNSGSRQELYNQAEDALKEIYKK
jgi:dephospho-CoA kinase